MLPDFLLPYNEVDTRNALFQQKWHHLRWLNSEARLRHYTYLILIGSPLIILLWWFIERFHVNFADVSPDLAYRLINLTLFAVLITMALSSYYFLPRIMGRFQTQFNSAYWDMLRLSPQLNSAILMSHDAIAQIRLWPLTAVEVGLRIAVVLLYALNNFYDALHPHPQIDLSIGQILLNPNYIGLSGILFFVGFVFILEPVIRVRLIIAFHITIATRIRNIPLTLLTAIIIHSLVHLAQLFLIVCLYTIYQAFNNQTMGAVGLAVCFVPLMGLTIVLLWAFYRWLRKAALDLAYSAAFRED